MENISQAINTFDSQHFMGKNGFVWWYGVVEDRKDPLYLGRVKVRVIGWHTDDKTEGKGIPTENLPWADVISPINSASISGIGTSPTGMVPGTHVFGFFRDGVEAQEPVVIGTSGGIPERFSNSDVGFFDPRTPEEREHDPYPPLFIQRDKSSHKGTIKEHPKTFSSGYADNLEWGTFEGDSKWADKEYSIFIRRDDKAKKSLIEIKDKEGKVLNSTISYAPHPDENRTRFDATGNLLWSLPSTNILASSLSQREDHLPMRPSPVATIWLRTHRMNAQLLEYSQRLHSAINTSNPYIKWEQPGSMATDGEPVYPFNHVNYTESGHAFEMDDTPGKERIRLLHRSTSYIEFLSTGDRVDNTIGEKFDMVDSNIRTHALGSSFMNVGGYHDLYVGGVGTSSRRAYNVKVASGSANIETEAGDINIIAEGQINLKGTDVIFTSGSSKPKSNRTFNLNGYNLKGEDMGECDFKSKSFVYHTSGDTSVSAAAYNLNATDINIQSNKQLNINSTMGSSEIINGLFTGGSASNPGYGKVVTTLAGKMQFNTYNPAPLLSGFEFNSGPIPWPYASSMKSGIMGFDYNSKLGRFGVQVGADFNVTAGTNIDMFSGTFVRIENALGGISIDPAGILNFNSKNITLGFVLSELMLALKNLTVPTGVGPSGIPINVAAFEAVDQKLKQMLKQ